MSALLRRSLPKCRNFYKRILHLEPKQYQADYVEFETPGATISLYEEASFAQIAPAAVPNPAPAA